MQAIQVRIDEAKTIPSAAACDPMSSLPLLVRRIGALRPNADDDGCFAFPQKRIERLSLSRFRIRRSKFVRTIDALLAPVDTERTGILARHHAQPGRDGC